METNNQYKFTVEFYGYAKSSGKTYIITEQHRSAADANLRALALNWQIKSITPINN